MYEPPGICVLTAKPDEPERWQRYCREAGRECILFGPHSGHCCDLLNYELAHGEASVESAAQLLDILVEVSSRSAGGRGDEQFWKLFAQKIFRRAIATIWLATGHCSLSDMYRLIVSAPESPDQVKDDSWRNRSYCAECLTQGGTRMPSHPAMQHDFQLCGDFWLVEWPGLSDKTRSVGHTMTTNVLDKFLSGPVARMVSGGTSNLTPDHVLNGAVVVLDMPVLRWHEPGQFFQVIFKTLVQRAALRRKNPTRPVCLWVDEAHFFVVPETDCMAQTVARQAKLISVVLTQNLPMLYAAMGGDDKARRLVDGWIANHSTKVICSNACKETNEYCSQLLGQSKQLLMNGSSQYGHYDLVGDVFGDAGVKVTGGFSEQWREDVPAGAFTKLCKGGPPDNQVEAYLFQGGRRYPENRNRTWVKTVFPQRF